MSHDDDYGDYGPREPGTRTRFAEGQTGDPYGGAPRRGRMTSPSRGVVTVVGVVVLLIAAIAFANRDSGGSEEGGGGKGDTETQPTAPSGERPVEGSNSGIPAGFPKTEQGAQSAAANYAVVLGSDGMFDADRRRSIVETLADSSAVSELQKGFDADYSPELNEQFGLNEDGTAPSGQTFVNRTVPVGTTLKQFEEDSATVSVWCNGLFGLTGEGSTTPVTNNWFTVTMELRWEGSDWKVLETRQKEGPTPVAGDNPVSGSDEIGDAIEEFGGFTYAR